MILKEILAIIAQFIERGSLILKTIN